VSEQKKPKRLKQCPFCGYRAIALARTRDENNMSEWFIECQTCKARGPERYRSQEAKEAWQNRADANGSITVKKAKGGEA
jgi:Lar family restriction alleviation protein